MKIDITSSNDNHNPRNGFLSLTPENEAEKFQLEDIIRRAEKHKIHFHRRDGESISIHTHAH